MTQTYLDEFSDDVSILLTDESSYIFLNCIIFNYLF